MQKQVELQIDKALQVRQVWRLMFKLAQERVVLSNLIYLNLL